MLCRLSLLALCATTLAAASSDSPVVVERDMSSVAAFPANLARRFTSTVGFLRSRGRAFIKDAPVERSISDELVSMLKGASSLIFELGKISSDAKANLLYSTTGLSRRNNASPSASAAWAEATEDASAEAAAPSASASQAAERMKRRDLDYVKQKIQDTPWEALDSTLLCPGTETACPM